MTDTTPTQAGRIEALNVELTTRLGQPPDMTFFGHIYYVPVIGGSAREELAARISLLPGDSTEEAFRMLVSLVSSRLGTENLILEDEVITVAPEVRSATLQARADSICLYLGSGVPAVIDRHSLTQSQRALFDNLKGTVEATAWNDLRSRYGLPSKATKPKVLISYRDGHQAFAEAVAHRLGKEGLLPLFDRWETKAGDSLPSKIAEWLTDSIASLVIVTADYQTGNWATVEFEGAITKRTTEGYTVVPILLEKCDLPELLKPLIYVDFSDQDAAEFERKMGEVINAIYKIEINPYRL